MKPFISIVLIILTLLSLVFFKMEVRRKSYVVWRQIQTFRQLKDRHRLLEMEYVKVTRPEHIRKYAVSHLTMGEARTGQIIQLTGSKIAVSQ